MGISDGLDGEAGVDGSVGTIVWVRRRNGSWWPGRILGPDDLSASHLISPRSGTPVKLLGREDASVDWYNLEKSKRVKAFRCGEFDACIERAEASQGIPIKKREKYARREDAILHALELEKKQKTQGNISIGISNKTTGAPKRELNSFSSEVYMRNDDPGFHSKFGSKKYQEVSRNTVVPQEKDNISNSLYIHKGISGKQFIREEDSAEAIPRMRGLQDFGLWIAQSKRKFSQSLSWETSRKPVDNHVDVLSGPGHMMGDAVHTGSSRISMSIKRKKSQGCMVEESLFRKRDRRRPVVQVLQSSVKLPISHSFQSDYDADVISMQDEKDHMGVVCRAKRSRCTYLPADSNDSLDHSGCYSDEMAVTVTQFGMDDHHHPVSLAEEYTSSEFIEATESDSSERVFWEDNMEEEANLLADATLDLVPGLKYCDPSKFQISDKFGNIDNDEMLLSTYMPQLHPHEQAAEESAGVGVSRWHMKGKRNSRNLAKRSIDAIDGKIFNGADKYNDSAKGTTYGSKGNSFKMGRMEPSSQRSSGRGLYHKKDANHTCDGGDLAHKNLGRTQLTGYGNRRYPFPLQAAKDRGRSHISFNDSDCDSQLVSQSGWEADGPSHAARRVYLGVSDECFEQVYAGRISDETESMLVDVDLKVQASYQGERVPLVSLMSKLNGKAIIGHPVQIEILRDGSSGQVVSRNVDLDDSLALPPVWRTAKRTAMQRVPRSNPATSALEGEDAEPLQYSDRESKPLFTKLYSGHFSHQAKLVKSISHARRPVSGKSHKKLVKSLSNQKIRTLSSIATDQKLRREYINSKLSRGCNILGGLIRPGEVVPLVTCVPVKVVFSRILETVSRPAAAVHRVRMNSLAVRDPS